MKNVEINGFYLLPEECKYNGRIKCRVDKDGNLVPLEILYCDRMIFNPLNVSVAERTKNIEWRLAYDKANAELFGGAFPDGKHFVPCKHPEDNIKRSKRRALNKLSDYILCNAFDCFVTLTLSPDEIDRHDYSAVIKKLSAYLDNRVRRNGLKYVGVPELHKKGGLHFHFLCNSAALKLIDSGTVSCSGHKRPIKIATADRLGIPLEDRHTVYNIADWSLGFSTAIMTYGQRGAVARYIGKYITKGDNKIGGRWYYSGGKLDTPIYKYERGGFNDLTVFTYDFVCDGGRFKVVKFGDNGEVILN